MVYNVLTVANVDFVIVGLVTMNNENKPDQLINTLILVLFCANCLGVILKELSFI